jgi:hypothetical protein
MHLARSRALARVVDGLLRGGVLALTALGRSLRGEGLTKHKVKCVDRLLGNPHLRGERAGTYQALSSWLLAGRERPVILVDWSDFQTGHDWLILKAALALRGRALTLYEEVHPLARYNSPKTHRSFLRHLQSVLPTGCRPILVTDAGFRGPWFRDVEACGWDWVGRVRNQVQYSLDGSTWGYTTALYRQATTRIRHLGRALLSHKNPYTCELYLVRMPARGPGRPLKRHGQGSGALRCRKLYKDPWLLATSLPHARGCAAHIKALYGKRMQIEETFRDLKGQRWGLALELARCRRAQRRELLLLIAALATLVLWLLGLVVTARGWTGHFQANTERRRPVLSIVFLGRELLRAPRLGLTSLELDAAAQQLRSLIHVYPAPA